VRQGAKHLSDVGFRTLVLAPYVFDAGIGALAVHQNPDVALQLALIDFEAFTFAGMTQLILSRTIGRKRPWAETCRPGDCESGDPVRSFDSGHSMASFTGAGLMCLHHEKLPLFGGGAPDTWACVWAVSAATTTSALRLIADEHWTSDVLLGAGLGWIYGYFLPKLLHFTSKTPSSSSSGARASAVTWRPMFTGTPEGGTVRALGTF
jgi:membrane-associated phospholipid phosphatase